MRPLSVGVHLGFSLFFGFTAGNPQARNVRNFWRCFICASKALIAIIALDSGLYTTNTFFAMLT